MTTPATIAARCGAGPARRRPVRAAGRRGRVQAPGRGLEGVPAERPDVAQLRRWFSGSRTGLGVVAGAVSGGIEMTELEGRAEAGAKVMLAVPPRPASSELWDRLVNGYVGGQPSGGIHSSTGWPAGDVPGNTKLAATAEHVTLAETRGEGGWFVTAPSFGHVHPDQALAVMAAARRPSHDHRRRARAVPRPAAHPGRAPGGRAGRRPTRSPRCPAGGTDGVSPGDDYNARTTWDEVLTADGWRRAFTRGEVTMWTRPGKTHGISATTGHMGDWLYVFTSTVLEPERTYTRFGYRRLAPRRRPPGRRQGAPGRGYGKATVDDGARPAGAGPPPTSPVRPPPAQGVAADQAFGLTDVGNARLLVAAVRPPAALRARARVVAALDGPPLGLRRGRRARRAGQGRAEDAAQVFADDKAAAQHFQRSLSRRGVEAMAVALARTDPAVVASPSTSSTPAHLLCTPGGVVDLRTGRAAPPTPPSCTPARRRSRPTPRCPTPRWEQFLADTFGNDAELIGYVQRLAGYSATGDVGAHILPFLYGPERAERQERAHGGARHLLGGYAGSRPGTFLTHGPDPARDRDRPAGGAALRGLLRDRARRPVRRGQGQDADRRRRADRPLHAPDHFSWSPTHHLWLMANDRPRSRPAATASGAGCGSSSSATGCPTSAASTGWPSCWCREEGPGILAWIVAGAVAYYSGGLREPVGVKAATAQYAAARTTWAGSSPSG
jgi:putative DNA primase/helicase